MSDLPAMPDGSGMEVSMGTKVSQYPFEKYKIAKGVKDIITVISENPIVARTLYSERIGYRVHLSKAMEQKYAQSPDLHYCFLAIRWNTDSRGLKILKNEEGQYDYEWTALVVKGKNYDKLVTKWDLNGRNLSKLALQVSLDGDEKYQGMNFEVINGLTPPYLKDKGLFGRIKDEYAAYKPYLPLVHAPVMSDEQFEEKWNEGSVSSEEREDFSRRSGTNNVLGPGKKGQDFEDYGSKSAEGVVDADFEEVGDEDQPAAAIKPKNQKAIDAVNKSTAKEKKVAPAEEKYAQADDAPDESGDAEGGFDDDFQFDD